MLVAVDSYDFEDVPKSDTTSKGLFTSAQDSADVEACSIRVIRLTDLPRSTNLLLTETVEPSINEECLRDTPQIVVSDSHHLGSKEYSHGDCMMLAWDCGGGDFPHIAVAICNGRS